MIMREWRGSSALRRRLGNKRHAALLALITFIVAGSSGALAVSLLVSDDSAAPWLSSSSDAKGLLLTAVMACVVGFIGGAVYGVVEVRRASRLAAGQPSRPSPFERGPSAYLLGWKWLFTGWRLWTVGLALLLSIAAYVVALFIPEARERVLDKTTGDVLFMNLFAAAWMVWALVLKGREVRRGKERIKVADEYLAIREARLNDDFNAMCVKFLQKQQDWEAEKTAQLYEQILDQQARGLLPCPNCRDQVDHRKSA
jgi:hypothetical protein